MAELTRLEVIELTSCSSGKSPNMGGNPSGLDLSNLGLVEANLALATLSSASLRLTDLT